MGRAALLNAHCQVTITYRHTNATDSQMFSLAPILPMFDVRCANRPNSNARSYMQRPQYSVVRGILVLIPAVQCQYFPPCHCLLLPSQRHHHNTANYRTLVTGDNTRQRACTPCPLGPATSEGSWVPKWCSHGTAAQLQQLVLGPVTSLNMAGGPGKIEA